jgi:hypothetical protein
MSQLLIAATFLAMVIAPCLVAMRLGKDVENEG